MKVKTRRWEEVEKKLFTPKEVAAGNGSPSARSSK